MIAQLVGGVLIRFVLPSILPQVPQSLLSAIEVSTPVNSFKSLQEAFYYLQHGIDLYDGGVNHHPPLLVIALNLVDSNLPKWASLVAFNALFTVVDIGCTLKLIQVNNWYNKHYGKGKGFSNDLIATFYLFNPLIILTNLSHSTLSFSLFLIVESLHQLLYMDNLSRAAISLATASYLSYWPGFLIVPLLGLAHSIYGKKDKLITAVGVFFASISILLFLSYQITGSTGFLTCYTTVFNFTKISPNLGLWWYLFTEMFDFFTPFYIGVFNIYSAIFILPITIRLHKLDPLLAFVLSYVWLSFTKSYPTVGDLGFALSLIPIFKDTVLPHCKFAVISGLTLLICLLLSPIFYYCWIVVGNGNSNFFYSVNLIWGGVHALIMMDLLWGRLTLDYNKANKVTGVRLTQI